MEVAQLRQEVLALQGLDEIQRANRRREAERQLAVTLAEEQAARSRIATEEAVARRQATAWQQEIELVRGQLEELRRDLVVTELESLLQSAGVYEYAHPLQDAVAYKDALAQLKTEIKRMVSERRAVDAITTWQVNGSSAQGAKMVKEVSTLMLRAYNAEADNCVRTVKPHSRTATISRLEKTRSTIAKLGRTMSIEVTWEYHSLRVQEIELTADNLVKKEEEKERIREEKERQRENQIVQRQLEKERERLCKERAHYAATLKRLQAQGKTEEAAQVEAQVAGIDSAIEGVDEREANIRAGYVYVISNLGSFGEEIVKIGMTRRLDPMDRVRELGDASVPFKFDVHALIFSDDAVGLENRLHNELADKRVNRVNLRREFFRARPIDVQRVLGRLAGNYLLEFTEDAEAVEWRASGATSTAAPAVPAPSVTGTPASSVVTPATSPTAAPRPDRPRELASGDRLPLSAPRLRLVVHHRDGGPIALDPLALLLTDKGEVSGDQDLVFYGQPEHPSGGVALAVDEHGLSHALRLDTALIGQQLNEMLLVAQLDAEEQRAGHAGGVLDVIDRSSGQALARVPLPAPSSTGLIQVGALVRTNTGWELLAQPAGIDLDLASLLREAGVSVDG